MIWMLAFWTVWDPWQVTQWGPFPEDFRAFPWPLSRKFFRIPAWHFPQNSGILAGSGVPTKPLCGDMAFSASLGSPPWQLWQEIPFWECQLVSHFRGMSRSSGFIISEEWHSMQTSFWTWAPAQGLVRNSFPNCSFQSAWAAGGRIRRMNNGSRYLMKPSPIR